MPTNPTGRHIAAPTLNSRRREWTIRMLRERVGLTLPDKRGAHS